MYLDVSTETYPHYPNTVERHAMLHYITTHNKMWAWHLLTVSDMDPNVFHLWQQPWAALLYTLSIIKIIIRVAWWSVIIYFIACLCDITESINTLMVVCIKLILDMLMMMKVVNFDMENNVTWGTTCECNDDENLYPCIHEYITWVV